MYFWTIVIIYTLNTKINFYIYSRQYLIIKERILSELETDQRFRKAYKTEEGTFVLHRNFSANPE